MKSYSQLPPELYRSRPRAVRLSGRGRALAVVAVLLCLAAPAVGLLLHRQAMTDRAERDALLQSGVVANGVVVRLKRDSKESKRASVYYEFDANGRTFADRAKIPIARWRMLHAGRPIAVRYVAANPEVNVPDGVEPHVMPAGLPYILSPLPFVIGVFFLLLLRYQRSLLSDGRAAMAVVKSVTQQRTQHGGAYRRVRYEFPLLSGAVQAGSMDTHGKGLDVGSSIAVLYKDDHPRRSRPYPLSLVRLEESD